MDLKYNFFLSSKFTKNSRFIIDLHKKIEKIDDWIFLSDLYDNWLKRKHITLKQNKIPKIIHHIWLGSPIPKKYKDFIETWKEKNPTWDFMFWDDEKLSDLNMVNKELFLKFKNYGAKSDIARLEILHQIGGLYLDTDFECLKQIDEKILLNDFVAGTGFNYFPEILNSFIASKPNSKFLGKCLRDLKKIKKTNLVNHEILDKTGPFFLTRSFFNYQKSELNNKENGLILPTNYFFPVPNFFRNLSNLDVYSFETSISIGIHHWEASWDKVSLYDRIRLKLLK